jgi:TctA family transporter
MTSFICVVLGLVLTVIVTVLATLMFGGNPPDKETCETTFVLSMTTAFLLRKRVKRPIGRWSTLPTWKKYLVTVLIIAIFVVLGIVVVSGLPSSNWGW